MFNSTQTTNKTDLISNIIRVCLVAIAITLFFLISGAATVYTAYNFYNFPCGTSCPTPTTEFHRGLAPCQRCSDG
jgi:hypothetical protein